MGSSANDRVRRMSVARVHALYIAKVEKKGRTRAEVDEVIRWLTGYSQGQLEALLDAETDFETFFAEAPAMNPNRFLITGLICGYRVEEIQDPVCARSATSISSSTSWRRARRWRRSCAGPPDYIRNTPNVVSGIGAFRLAEIARPSTSRVWAGSMMPSSHRRAVA